MMVHRLCVDNICRQGKKKILSVPYGQLLQKIKMIRVYLFVVDPRQTYAGQLKR